MTWGNPPKLISDAPKQGKKITPEQIAASGSESSHQKAIMVWAAMNFIKYPQLKYLFHIPNGGSRNIREAVELKAQGVKAGVPDLFLPVGFNSGYFGCFIEMKIGKNKLSEEQQAWFISLRDLGYYCKVCYGWEEARDTLIAYLEGKV